MKKLKEMFGISKVMPNYINVFDREADEGKKIFNGVKMSTGQYVLRIWTDNQSIYIDMYDGTNNSKRGDVCLLSMTPDEDGFLTEIYGDYSSGLPTYTYHFTNLKDAFNDWFHNNGYLIGLEDEEGDGE